MHKVAEALAHFHFLVFELLSAEGQKEKESYFVLSTSVGKYYSFL